MNVTIFVGPTIAPALLRALLPNATVLPPARCGDVYRVARQRPHAIAIIDGYFDHQLSVWHKEILWALTSGVLVYGAASLGALRAAELAAFGMHGVGQVYEQFLNGALEDDDEVAVLHESEERGYGVRSDAMVNLRATLRAAVVQGIIDSETEASLIAAGKGLFYADRSFANLLDIDTGLAPEQKSVLQRWFDRHGLIDQKREDALALARHLVALDAQPPGSGPQPTFQFSNTNYWRVLKERLDATLDLPANAGPKARREAALQALRRLTPQDRRGVELAAIERALALHVAAASGARVSPTEVQAASERFRRQLGLVTPDRTNEWLARRGLDLASFSEFARDQALVDRFSEQARSLALAQLAAALYLSFA